MFLSAAVATVAGVASWGFHPSPRFSGSVVSASEGLLLVFAANACYLIPLLDGRRASACCCRLPPATAPRRSWARSGFVILLYIVAAIPGLEGIQPYLLTEQFENWHGLLRTPTDWAPIWHSAWVCALYAVPALFAAYLVFLRRDVAGG